MSSVPHPARELPADRSTYNPDPEVAIIEAVSELGDRGTTREALADTFDTVGTAKLSQILARFEDASLLRLDRYRIQSSSVLRVRATEAICRREAGDVEARDPEATPSMGY